jgi:hypothetical protein
VGEPWNPDEGEPGEDAAPWDVDVDALIVDCREITAEEAAFAARAARLGLPGGTPIAEGRRGPGQPGSAERRIRSATATRSPSSWSPARGTTGPPPRAPSAPPPALPAHRPCLPARPFQRPRPVQAARKGSRLSRQPQLAHQYDDRYFFCGGFGLGGGLGASWCTKLTAKPFSTTIFSQLAASRCTCAPGKTPVTPIRGSRGLRLLAADGGAGTAARSAGVITGSSKIRAGRSTSFPTGPSSGPPHPGGPIPPNPPGIPSRRVQDAVGGGWW